MADEGYLVYQNGPPNGPLSKYTVPKARKYKDNTEVYINMKLGIVLKKRFSYMFIYLHKGR